MRSVKCYPAFGLFSVDFVVFAVQQLVPFHFDCFDIHLVPDLIKIPFPNRSYPIRAFPYRPHVLLFRMVINWWWWMDGWARFATNSNVSLLLYNINHTKTTTRTWACACERWRYIFKIEFQVVFFFLLLKMKTDSMCSCSLRGFMNLKSVLTLIAAIPTKSNASTLH